MKADKRGAAQVNWGMVSRASTYPSWWSSYTRERNLGCLPLSFLKEWATSSQGTLKKHSILIGRGGD